MLVVVGVSLGVPLASELQARSFAPAAWGGESVRTLFVGSSHVGNAVASALPKHGPTTGVLHYPGIYAYIALTVLGQQLDRWPKLELLVLEADEFILLTDAEAHRRNDLSPLAGRLWLNLWDLPYYPDEPERLWWRVSNALRGQGLTLLHPELRLTLPNVLKHKLRTTTFFAAPPTAPQSDADPNNALETARANARVSFLRKIGRRRPEINSVAFVELAQVLSRRGVRIAFLTLPTHATYTAVRPMEWQLVASEAVDTARRATGQPLPWWDLRSDPRFSDDRLYQNVDHLNREGASRMADILGPLIRSE